MALITQRRAVGLTFICCYSTDTPPCVIQAEQAFLDAMRDLNQAALDSEDSKLPAPHALVEQRGREAFNALPEDVRNAILRHKTILLVPDYSAGHDVLPFELLHEGKEYLLSRVVIARFTSLQQLAAILDRGVMTPGKRRALVIGVDRAKGYIPLPLAETERQNVCAALASAGFDAPTIKPERVTSRFITDRLSFVDIFHVSGHGETALGTERLFLSDGGWLDSAELERRPQATLPFVYLNTCELGEARFLGGGRGRGLAFTFAEQGAPAVLAHTTAVFDDVSAALASAFYGEALKRPVGEALRLARKELLKSYPASEISRLVLLGNPKHALPGVEQTSRVDDPTNDLLDRYFDLHANRWQRSDVLTYMILHGNQGGPRLKAAACLVMSREEAMYANEGNDPLKLRDAIALSEAINHRPSAALFKLRLAWLSVKHGAQDAGEQLRAALPDVNVLARSDSRWEEQRKQIVTMLLELELKRHGIDLTRLQRTAGENPDSLPAFVSSLEENADSLLGFVSSLADIEGLWEIEAPQLRVLESTLEDVVWNAVVAGYPNRFESVPERLDFIAALVNKLSDKGYLAASARDVATPILATAFTCVWSAQERGRYSRESAAAQTHMIEGLLHEVRSSWSPPDAELLGIVGAAAEAIEAALQRLEKAGWMESYEILDSEMAAVKTLAERAIESAVARFPDSKNCCSAFIAGCFMTKNKYEAAFQGDSMPKRLSAIFDALSADMRKLVSEAYVAIDSDRDDELIRWRKEDCSHNE